MEPLARETNAWACYDCGKCSATCPLTRAGADYSPRRHVLATNLGQTGSLDESVFSCLTCGQCDLRCPAQVEYTELVRRLRAEAAGRAHEPRCPHGGALQSVMRMMASGGTRPDRLGWMDGDLAGRPEQGEVFLWVGCTPFWDAFFPELEMRTVDGTRAALRLLNLLGVTPVVSADERCCGHDLLWNGDVASFQALARHNVDLVASSGAETVVVPCAECLRTWKVDYQPYLTGARPRILHLTEYLSEIADGLDLEEIGGRVVTYHDPCRLGRHLGIYDPPRSVLRSVPGLQLAEMRRSGPRALCCAGSAWSNCDRHSKSIQVERLREARATGAEVLVTACPKCQVHLRCAMRDPTLGDEIGIELRDVAEILTAALPGA